MIIMSLIPDEPVFGCSLEQITKNRTPRVPVFVEKCIECIESKEENLKTDGLYRASGNLSQVQKIRLEVWPILFFPNSRITVLPD